MSYVGIRTAEDAADSCSVSGFADRAKSFRYEWRPTNAGPAVDLVERRMCAFGCLVSRQHLKLTAYWPS